MRIYQINTRVHCAHFGQVTETELAEIARLGFDTVWFMGVWQISDGAWRISKLVSEDFEGSPYAVPDYAFNNALGGESGFAGLVQRAHSAGLQVMVDFVSNHMAIDSAWIDEHPEFFITSNLQARRQATSDYYLHPSGKVVAFGRDPYFPPWHDTSQLDYTSPGLRARMIETLKRLGRVADGVRCDMAMLVLRDYIRQQWYPLADQAWFDQKFPTEFWAEAIAEVRKQRPDFSFVAEAYWDKEQQLIDLGFDLAYEKKLYDALVARDAEQVRHRISRERRVLERCLNFIENHDEPRAASLFTRADNLASAALMLSLPGSALIHEGQMEGFTEKLPVQRLRPLKQETPDRELKEGYTRLLTLTRDKVFESGRFELFETGAYGVVSFARIGQGRAVAYAGQISRAWHTFFSLSLDLTQIALAIEAGERIRVKNMMTGLSVGLKRQGGDFSIGLRTLGIAEDASFCLIEVTPE